MKTRGHRLVQAHVAIADIVRSLTLSVNALDFTDVLLDRLYLVGFEVIDKDELEELDAGPSWIETDAPGYPVSRERLDGLIIERNGSGTIVSAQRSDHEYP